MMSSDQSAAHPVIPDAAQLATKYDLLDGWGEHPQFSMADWRAAVAAEDTRRGYWEWVVAQLEMQAGGDMPEAIP